MKKSKVYVISKNIPFRLRRQLKMMLINNNDNIILQKMAYNGPQLVVSNLIWDYAESVNDSATVNDSASLLFAI